MSSTRWSARFPTRATRPSRESIHGVLAAMHPLRNPSVRKRMFVSSVVTGAAASSTPGRHPTPNLTRAPASPGGHRPHTGRARGAAKPHATVTGDAGGWLAYVRLEDPPGLSPITTVGRYDSVEAAQVAVDEVWASR